MSRNREGPWIELVGSGKALLGVETAERLGEENPGEWVALRRGPDGSVTVEKLDLGEDVIAVSQILRNRARGCGPDVLSGFRGVPAGRYLLAPGLHDNWFRIRRIE